MKKNSVKTGALDRAETKLAAREKAMAAKRTGKVDVLPVKSRIKAGAANIYGIAE